MISHKNNLIADLTQQESSRQVIPGAPLLSSEYAQWSSIFFTHYHHFTHESPHHQWAQHLIGITGSGSLIKAEHRLDGQFSKHCYGNGEILIIPAGASFWSFWQQEAEFFLLGISPQFLKQIGQEFVKSDCLELLPKVALIDPLIHQIALALKSDITAGHPIGHLFGESLATTLAARLLEHHTAGKFQFHFDVKGLPKYRLKQVLDYIESHLDRSFTLAQLADLLDMSQYHFCRQFKQSMGIAPHQYVTQRRIEQAKKLLWGSQLSITEIALQIGFATPSAFTRLFRQLTGMTPRAYRNQR